VRDVVKVFKERLKPFQLLTNLTIRNILAARKEDVTAPKLDDPVRLRIVSTQEATTIKKSTQLKELEKYPEDVSVWQDFCHYSS
jgi:hypothetical protein